MNEHANPNLQRHVAFGARRRARRTDDASSSASASPPSRCCSTWPTAKWRWRAARRFKAANPDKYFLMGADPRLPKMPDEADADRLLQQPLRLAQSSAAKRDARAQGRPQREGRARLPVARHRCRRLHPLRPRLLGRADDRALCRRGSELGGAHASGAALFSDPSVGYEYPEMYVNISAPIISRSLTSSPNTSARRTTSIT